jgi:hypothetical protein
MKQIQQQQEERASWNELPIQERFQNERGVKEIIFILLALFLQSLI